MFPHTPRFDRVHPRDRRCQTGAGNNPTTVLNIEGNLELLAENNLLTLPEELGEVTEEKWNEIIQENKMRQRQALFDEVKSNAGDPRIAELVDFAYNGGSWYGVEEMQQAIQAEINLEELDTTSEDDQRYLIESYLSEGLNISHLRSGIYLLKIFEDDKINTIKIVKD